MTGRYEYELIHTDDKKERLRADDHYLEGNFFKFVVFDENGAEVVEKTINSGLIERIDRIADGLVPGSGE
jgi:hypothetical protein